MFGRVYILLTGTKTRESVSINPRVCDLGIRCYQLYASARFIPVEGDRVPNGFLVEWVKGFVKMLQVAGLV